MSSDLLTLLRENPFGIVDRDSIESLQLVKKYFDSVIEQFKTDDDGNKTVIDEITIDGLDANQVWWQAKMVIENVEGELLRKIQKVNSIDSEEISEEDDDDDEIREEDQLEEEDDDEDEEQSEDDDNAEEANEEDKDEDSEDNLDEIIANGKDDFDELEKENDKEINDEAPSDIYESDQEKQHQQQDQKAEPNNGLNDKFFDIEEFNRQTLAQEEGNLEDDENNNDDDDDIDYFGDLPSEDDEDVAYYNDFFDKPTKRKTNSTSKQNQINDVDSNADDDDDDIDAMNKVKLDLFEEDDDNDMEDEDDIANEDGTKMTNYERQQLEIQKQIAKLEEEAVAEKKWALKGEVKAKDRPEDALLEEELEFDRNAKPVPVITSDVTESLEELIRKRIHDYNFDDLERRTALDITKKRFKPDFELSDVKSSKSLAEIYEDDYKGVDNDLEISEELQKNHDEITQLFQNLSYKLDALSSAHFIPKPSTKSLEVRVNTAAITMEDAQPLTMSNASTLAPQEVYQVGKSDNADEIRLKDGTTMARAELSREDKTRLRRAAKRKRTKHLLQQKPVKKNKKDSIIETLSTARNITVINKQGEKHDIKGNKKRSQQQQSNNVKL